MVENEYGVKVGTAVTITIGSDAYPGVVTRVTPKTIVVHSVEYGPNRCQWPEQDFPVYLDKIIEGTAKTFRRTKRGWSSHGTRAYLGEARYYQDPHF